MDETKEKIMIDIMNSAIDAFNKNERYLIEYDLSERCICAKFAHYLAIELNKGIYREYYVDVEYNRTIRRNIKSLEKKNIVVDLIVHKRGIDDNLVCIEMKKCCARQDCIKKDEDRLKKLTSIQYSYMYGLGIMILIKRDGKNNVYKLLIDKIFKNGNEVTEECN